MPGAVLILGATSAIARGAACAFARRGHPLYLAARDLPETERIAADLAIRYGVPVRCGIFEAEAYATHSGFLGGVVREMNGLAGVLLASGYMADSMASRNFESAARVIAINFTGAASILGLCADYLEKSGAGFIIGITSVAGDRGRQSNYPYGAAKAGLSVLLQGLRNRLFPAGVRVITIKPGFVDTAMTFGMPGLFLVASPADVGERIVRSLDGRSDVLYVPWFWRYIMWAIRSIPETLFKRLKL